MKTVLSFFLILSAAPAAERWYEVRIAGQPAGYEHSTTETRTEGGAVSTDETVIVINRLGGKVEMKTKSESTENVAGELMSVREAVTQSEQTVVTEAELKGDQIQLRSTAGSNSYNRSMTLKAPVCGPAAFARQTREQLRKLGDATSCRLYDPSLGVPFKTTRTLSSVDTLDGRLVLRVKTELEGAGAAEELLDAEGLLLRMERDLPFGKMVVQAADRQTALQAANGADLPAESYERTMARSNVRFADARAVERLTLKITHKKPELGWPGFVSPTQTIREKTATSLVLEVVQPERKVAATKIDEAPFLRPNQILQSDDPEVIRLAREIAGGVPDRFLAARKLQDWMAANMKFDLGVAVAPASEVVRNRKGTCVAYAVLLASMARALGIPSRLAMGYIYLAGIWGGHAWVEVLVDNQWLPIDAAGYRPGLADAARIQFGSYTAENNLAGFLAAGLQMYGNVEIAVMEYTVAGKRVVVPESAPPYSVSGDVYRNPGLGVAIAKPAGFELSKLDAVYPDPAIAELQLGASKVTVSLLEAIANPELAIRSGIDGVIPGAPGERAMLDGRLGVSVSSSAKAKLLVPEGQSLWVLTAEGPDARGLLNRIAGGWKWLSPR